MEADKGFAANVFGYGRRQAVNHRFLQRDIKGNSSPNGVFTYWLEIMWLKDNGEVCQRNVFPTNSAGVRIKLVPSFLTGSMDFFIYFF